jgi:hypothetical protein
MRTSEEWFHHASFVGIKPVLHQWPLGISMGQNWYWTGAEILVLWFIFDAQSPVGF